MKSVKSVNPFQSPPEWLSRAGVIQTIVKAHGGELKVEPKPARAGKDGEGEGCEFVVQLPIV